MVGNCCFAWVGLFVLYVCWWLIWWVLVFSCLIVVAIGCCMFWFDFTVGLLLLFVIGAVDYV